MKLFRKVQRKKKSIKNSVLFNCAKDIIVDLRSAIMQGIANFCRGKENGFKCDPKC